MVMEDGSGILGKGSWVKQGALCGEMGGCSKPVELGVFTATRLHRLMESGTSQLTTAALRFLTARLGELRLSGQLHSFLFLNLL